jgi:hypothetical protein
MQNNETKVEGDKLHIIVDVSEKARRAAPLSKSGKAKLVASSHGFARVGNVDISLNVTCKQ